MANAERGEAELIVGTTAYTLVLSMNAICDMQTRTGKTYGELVRSLQALDFLALRDIMWMTLKKYHAKQFPDADKVGDFIDGLDAGPSTAIDALTRLFALNEARGEKKAVGADPQKPLPGEGSISAHAA